MRIAWATLVLPLPALIPLVNSCLVPYRKGLVPTGFVEYDMPYYMANAREHFDQGFQLTYGNPYAPYGTPAIYSQPHILLLAFLQRLGLHPGVAFNLFGLAALFFAAWVAVRFYQEAVGLETPSKKLGLVCFFWGGGILSASGLAHGLSNHLVTWQSSLMFDPADGWWMLNFGRNLVYPTEAYYHGAFLLSLLLLMQRRFVASLALAVLLSWSHPFCGLSLALILTVYAAVELVLRSQAVKLVTLIGAALLVACHLGYYWVFLNRFSDHRAVQAQWALGWLYGPKVYLRALCIVGLLAIIRFIRPPGLRPALTDSRVRLFLVWFTVVFALTQHNLVRKPLQPIHFAHGYDWMALFFLGAPALIWLLDRLLAIPSVPLRPVAVAMLLTIILFDNIVWFASFMGPSTISRELAISKDQNGVLAWLNKNAAPPEMVVCQDWMVSYLINTYTPVRTWYGHFFNTPNMAARGKEVEDAFQKEQFLPEWRRMHILYVAPRTGWNPPANATALFSNGSFTVWEALPSS